jgi:hypothetical protein
VKPPRVTDARVRELVIGLDTLMKPSINELRSLLPELLHLRVEAAHLRTECGRLTEENLRHAAALERATTQQKRSA